MTGCRLLSWGVSESEIWFFNLSHNYAFLHNIQSIIPVMPNISADLYPGFRRYTLKFSMSSSILINCIQCWYTYIITNRSCHTNPNPYTDKMFTFGCPFSLTIYTIHQKHVITIFYILIFYDPFKSIYVHRGSSTFDFTMLNATET